MIHFHMYRGFWTVDKVGMCKVCLLYSRGHDDLGDHYLDCGDLANALKCYSRARDYCTTARHLVNMCLNVIKVMMSLIQICLVAFTAMLCLWVCLFISKIAGKV